VHKYVSTVPAVVCIQTQSSDTTSQSEKYRTGSLISIQYHKYAIRLMFASPRIVIRFQQFNQQEATLSQVYYLTFMCGSACIRRLPAHHQEHTTALGATGLTVGEQRLERCWSWYARPRPTTIQPHALQPLNHRFLVQLYAPDDGREDARNMLSHT